MGQPRGPWGMGAPMLVLMVVDSVCVATSRGHLMALKGFPHSSVGKESTCNAGDPGLIPGSGRSAGEWIGYPLQYSGLENSMDYNGATQSQTQLSYFHFTKERGEVPW